MVRTAWALAAGVILTLASVLLPWLIAVPANASTTTPAPAPTTVTATQMSTPAPIETVTATQTATATQTSTVTQTATVTSEPTGPAVVQLEQGQYGVLSLGAGLMVFLAAVSVVAGFRR